MSDQLKQVLDDFDNRKASFTEMTFFTAIDSVVKHYDDSGEQRPEGLTAEWIAFNLLPDYEGGEGAWGTYYGPSMIRTRKDGQQISIPSLEQITPAVIAYWEGRARSAKNPLLK